MQLVTAFSAKLISPSSNGLGEQILNLTIWIRIPLGGPKLKLIFDKHWKIRSTRYICEKLTHIIVCIEHPEDIRRISDVGWQQY